MPVLLIVTLESWTSACERALERKERELVVDLLVRLMGAPVAVVSVLLLVSDLLNVASPIQGKTTRTVVRL